MEEFERTRSLGETIRARRVALGWTQEELAARIGGEGDVCHQSDVSRLERGRVGLPRRARLERIAAALGLPVGDLLARSGWAGAEAAFHPAAGAVPAQDEQQATVRRAAEEDALGAVPAPRLDAAARLMEAVTQSRELQARSADLLRKSATTLSRAGRPRFEPDDLASDPRAGDVEMTHGA